MTKLLLLIALILASSYGLGFELQKRFHPNPQLIALPIGFATLFFTLQLFYYPIQFFNLPSLYIHIISSFGVLCGLVLFVINIKAIVKQVMHIKLLWVFVYLLAFLFILYHASISLPFSDSQMYLNYIAQNINTDHINLFNLWTGKMGTEFDTIYLFQGYYHFSAFFNLAVNSLYYGLNIGHEISVIVTSVYGMGVFYAIVYGTAIVNFIDEIKPKSKITEIVAYIIALFYLGFYYYRIVFSFYGNSWRTLFITLMIFECYQYAKAQNKNHIYFATLFLGAAITTSSSSLFIGFAVIYGFAAYLFSQKEKNTLKYLSILISPIILYALIMFIHDQRFLFYPLFALVILYYGAYVFKWGRLVLQFINDFIIKIHKLLFILIIPTFAIIMAYLIVKDNPDYLYGYSHFFQNHSNYDMVQDYLFLYSDVPNFILNLFRYGGLILIIVMRKTLKQYSFIVWMFISITLLFLNPYTTAFIAKFMASNVYYRAYDALFNPFTEVLYIIVVLDYVSHKKLIQGLLVGLLIYALGYYHYFSYIKSESNSGYGFYIEEGKSVMPLEKIPYSEYMTIQAFKERIKTDSPHSDQWTVISHADGLRTFVPEAYQIFTARAYWYEWDRVDETFYYAAKRYYSWEAKLYPTAFATACMYLQQFDVDYVLVDNLNNYEFYTESLRCSDEVFITDGFSLLDVR